MLYQPVHGRPLVLGRPSRHTVESLSFCQNQDFVFELTHPWVISSLYSDPKFLERLKNIQCHGREILEKNRIRHVIFHLDDRLFNSKVKEGYLRLLQDVLGPPASQEGNALVVFEVYEGVREDEIAVM
jgi:hypothetical protein